MLKNRPPKPPIGDSTPEKPAVSTRYVGAIVALR